MRLVYSAVYAVIATLLMTLILACLLGVIGHIKYGSAEGLLGHYIFKSKIASLFLTNIICGLCFGMFYGKEGFLAQSALSKLGYGLLYICASILVFAPISGLNQLLLVCQANSMNIFKCLDVLSSEDISNSLLAPLLGIFRLYNLIFLALNGMLIAFSVAPILNMVFFRKEAKNATQ